MATIYNVEITSHWLSYSKEELEMILKNALNQTEKEKGNTITIQVKTKD